MSSAKAKPSQAQARNSMGPSQPSTQKTPETSNQPHAPSGSEPGGAHGLHAQQPVQEQKDSKGIRAHPRGKQQQAATGGLSLIEQKDTAKPTAGASGGKGKAKIKRREVEKAKRKENMDKRKGNNGKENGKLLDMNETNRSKDKRKSTEFTDGGSKGKKGGSQIQGNGIGKGSAKLAKKSVKEVWKGKYQVKLVPKNRGKAEVVIIEEEVDNPDLKADQEEMNKPLRGADDHDNANLHETEEHDVGEEEELGEEEESEEQEDVQNKPTFVSEMMMRAKRGTKVDKLLRNESVGYDAFWEENKYFGKVDDLSDDSEEYDFEKELQNKGGKDGDSFDSDFGMSSESSSDEDEDENEGDGNGTARGRREKFIEDSKLSRSAGYEGRVNPDGKAKIKKKKKQYTMNLDIEKEVVKVTGKKEEKKKKVVKKDANAEWKPRFIHEIYTQEKLLRDAVAQEYLNKYDLVNRWLMTDSNDEYARIEEEDLCYWYRRNQI
jgi:hypothetical protein